jgi:hypothetical protein
MPTAEASVTIPASRKETLERLRNSEFLASTLKFVERQEVDKAGKVNWYLRFPMSKTTRTKNLELSMKVDEVTQEISWEGIGQYITWRGFYRLEEKEPKVTSAYVKLEVEGKGPMASVINPVAALQIKNQLNYHITRILELIEGGKKT